MRLEKKFRTQLRYEDVDELEFADQLVPCDDCEESDKRSISMGQPYQSNSELMDIHDADLPSAHATLLLQLRCVVGGSRIAL